MGNARIQFHVISNSYQIMCVLFSVSLDLNNPIIDVAVKAVKKVTLRINFYGRQKMNPLAETHPPYFNYTKQEKGTGNFFILKWLY